METVFRNGKGRSFCPLAEYRRHRNQPDILGGVACPIPAAGRGQQSLLLQGCPISVFWIKASPAPPGTGVLRFSLPAENSPPFCGQASLSACPRSEGSAGKVAYPQSPKISLSMHFNAPQCTPMYGARGEGRTPDYIGWIKLAFARKWFMPFLSPPVAWRHGKYLPC